MKQAFGAEILQLVIEHGEQYYVLKKFVSAKSCESYDGIFIHPEVPGVKVYVGDKRDGAATIISIGRVSPEDFPSATKIMG